MTNRQDIWNLLVSRAGEWIDRDDLNFVGGEDAARRMRDIRNDVIASGEWRLDERKDDRKRIQWMLVKIAPLNEADAPQLLRHRYRCTNCQSIPFDYMHTQPTLDPRWRMGKCNVCRTNPAMFKKVS
jgi:hypothetical protein